MRHRKTDYVHPSFDRPHQECCHQVAFYPVFALVELLPAAVRYLTSPISTAMRALRVLILLSFGIHTQSFVLSRTSCTTQQPLVALDAKSNKNKKKPSTSGFGGAAAESCPCGSGDGYMKCCGKLHKNIFAFQKGTPEQVVRARYTAYAKREIDFIIQSTHPKNEKFQGDIKHWREQIDLNCYDNFELTKCEILEETIVDKNTAKVCFVANMVQRDSRERTSFQETSTFEKIAGAWLYKEGEIVPVPGSEAEAKLAADEEDSQEEDPEEEDAVEEQVKETSE